MDTQDIPIDVKPDLELDKFLEFVTTKLKGCPDIAKLEKYDEDFECWLPIKGTTDLKLSEGDIFKVTFSVSREVCVVVILSM